MNSMIKHFCFLTLLSVVNAFAADVSLENESADRDDPEFIHQNCYSYLHGEGIEKNLEEAFSWCERGAALEIPSSITLLAEMYRHGLFVDKDDDRARELYLQAANLGHVHAQYMVGHLALVLAKSQEDVELTCRWLTRAANRGYERAQLELRDLERLYSESRNNENDTRFCEGYD